MKRFVLQVTPEGGPEGTRIVEADDFSITFTGGITFFIDAIAVASFAEYCVVCAEDFVGNITEPEEE